MLHMVPLRGIAGIIAHAAPHIASLSDIGVSRALHLESQFVQPRLFWHMVERRLSPNRIKVAPRCINHVHLSPLNPLALSPYQTFPKAEAGRSKSV